MAVWHGGVKRGPLTPPTSAPHPLPARKSWEWTHVWGDPLVAGLGRGVLSCEFPQQGLAV